MPAARHSRTKSLTLDVAGQRCLLLGGNGAGMTALAEILVTLGHTVTGIDKNVDVPEQRHPNIRILPWSHQEGAAQSFDICVASPAIPQNEPVLQQVLATGIPVISLHECLADVFSGSRQMCVAGTHGKSTTSAMLAWILEVAGVQPGFFVGAHQSNFDCSGRGATTNAPAAVVWSVLESCEYSRSFHHFAPTTVVLTGIERDHFDCFPDQPSEDAAFRTFVEKLPTDGTVVFNLDCQRSRQLASVVGRPTATFQLIDDDPLTIGSAAPQHGQVPSSANHWVARQIRHAGFGTHFQLHNGDQQYSIRLAIPGRHNVANATAAIVAATQAGISIEECRVALATFQGIRRRFELCGQYNGMTLVDDYAHHPTAIRATLRTAREAYPDRRIIAAFEPHQIIRTAALFPEFVNSLLLADEILLLPAFPARENVTHLECCRTSGRLVKELNNRGAKAFLFANLDQIVSRIDHSGRPTDIILTMGAGRTNLIHDQLTRRLQRHSVA
jgi:UDP-N-acetylmuramate--alanine ligase